MLENACERQKMGMADNCSICKELNNEVYKRCNTKNR